MLYPRLSEVIQLGNSVDVFYGDLSVKGLVASLWDYYGMVESFKCWGLVKGSWNKGGVSLKRILEVQRLRFLSLSLSLPLSVSVSVSLSPRCHGVMPHHRLKSNGHLNYGQKALKLSQNKPGLCLNWLSYVFCHGNKRRLTKSLALEPTFLHVPLYP